MPDIPHVLTNPVFVAIILTALAAGSYFFEAWLDRKYPEAPAPITFTSDRKPVTLPLAEILYVESNDDITRIDVDLLYLGDDIQLPVSRKYRDSVKFSSIPSDRRTS